MFLDVTLCIQNQELLYIRIMKKIGLTGGIGSGKSTVAGLFAALGVPVFISDLEAKKLQDENEHVRSAIKALFGDDVYKSDGKLDRKMVASKVFGKQQVLERLNAIIHPAVAIAFEEFCKKHSDAPYIIKEAAILFESGAWRALDAIITVAAPEEMRVQRVMNRDHVTKDDVLIRIGMQWSDEDKIKRSQYVVCNDEKELLLPQVLQIHQELCR
ncbi:MAG: dephospho-CoA kinase [Bacteroidia bacterium]